MQQIAKHIHFALGKAKKIVIIPHQHPDADALGAATALFEYLNNLNKDVHIYCFTESSPKLHFMPHREHLKIDPEIFTDFTNADGLISKPDVIIVVDSGDLRYAGVYEHLKNHQATIINIDHHITNEHFGHINLVIPTASSTCEIVFNFFKHNHVLINKKMATSLLSGVLTDTGNFTNSATSASALAATSELLRAGGDYTHVNDAVVRNKTIPTLKLWGKIFSRLTHHEPMKLTYTYFTQADLVEHNLPDSETEGIANFLNNLENTDIALILKETSDGQIKGSLRTTKDGIDVAAMAKKLNGGGHKKAAGFTMPGTIESVLDRILTASK
ncbi:MAG: bifunctional oligoribonuclease/PAP phosphatase NrnA [Candidatus Magasanikbacteria bacterium]|nr:bifunctional oligoribonuclease/PAP phosphatase NrnA [Candidatus Magasanikbacteria bacterium]